MSLKRQGMKSASGRTDLVPFTRARPQITSIRVSKSARRRARRRSNAMRNIVSPTAPLRPIATVKQRRRLNARDPLAKDMPRGNISPKEAKHDLAASHNVEGVAAIESLSRKQLQVEIQNFEAKTLCDQTLQINAYVYPARIYTLIMTIINECQRSGSLADSQDQLPNIPRICATMMDDFNRATRGEVSLFSVVPRLWFKIRQAVRPVTSGNYSFTSLNPFTGSNSAYIFQDYTAITGYSDNVFYTNVSSGVVPSPFFVNDGTPAPVMNSFGSASYLIAYDYTAQFFSDYPYILDNISPAQVNPPNEDPSAFAYRKYITPPVGDSNNYLWMQNNYTFRDSIPGVWPIQDSGTAVPHPGFLSNAGPFLEVPIRNRWLASLGIFTEPTPNEIAMLSAPPRYPRHTVNVQSSAHPKTELFHQLYVRRMIRALSYAGDVPDPIKLARNKADLSVAKMHLRAVPVLTYIPNDQLVTMIVKGFSLNANATGFPTTNATTFSAAVMIDIMRHFQQWCSAVPLFSFADLSLAGTKTFLPTYGGGVGRLVRAQADLKLPVAAVVNLSMIYPTIVTDSGSAMLVTKMIYPALVQQLTPKDFLGLYPPFSVTVAPVPWSSWNSTIAYCYWAQPVSNAQEVMDNTSLYYPTEVNKLVHHPDYNLCSVATIVVNTSLSLQSRSDLLRGFPHESKQCIKFGEQLQRDFQEQLHSMRSTVESPSANAVPDVRIYLETAAGKLLIDAALNFIVPYFTSGTTDVLAIASLLSLPLHFNTHGDTQLVSNKEAQIELTIQNPGGLFNNFNEEITTYLDSVKSLADMSRLTNISGLSLSGLARQMPGILAAVFTAVKSSRRKAVPAF